MIDEDQGKSGASAQGRDGFRRLVENVVKGDAGAVLALEVSRLSRSSEDWRRLLGLCGVAGVAVIDEQAIYDPSDPDDKLLLDLKGTMSEAELHWLGLRLMGARRQKARRGELEILPPTGYVWSDGALVLDPDESVVRAIRALLDRFRVEPSVWGAAPVGAREQGQKMPTRRTYADGTTEVVWETGPGVAPVLAAPQSDLRRRVRVRPLRGRRQDRRRQHPARDPARARSEQVARRQAGRASRVHHVGGVLAQPGHDAPEHGAHGISAPRCSTRRRRATQWPAGVRSLRPSA